MFATRNERGAGDGHDFVLTASASEVANDQRARNVFNDTVDSLKRNGFTEASDVLGDLVEHAKTHAEPIRKHETASGTDDDQG